MEEVWCVFVLSAKMSRKKLLLFCAGAVLLALLFLLPGRRGVVPAAGTPETAAGDNSQRVAYLKAFGWTVEEEPCEVVEVVIPAEFGEVYGRYNEIQKEQGFDLSDYRGKQVRRYTYIITNYPGKPENVRANLLVSEGKIIGGDVCSLELDGFLHGFSLDSREE